jgi:hypothetical protein
MIDAAAWAVLALFPVQDRHEEAANALADRIAELRKADRNVPIQALVLAAGVHLAQAPVGAGREEIAKRLGLVFKDGVPGTEEGHAVGDLQYWISWQDYDLAETAFRVNYRELDSPSVRFVRSWALLKWAVEKKRGYDRALAALVEIKAPEGRLRDHVAALVKSVRAVLPCLLCEGKGRVRCGACRGLACDACEMGDVKCPKCEGPRPAPKMDDLCTTSACELCEGRGFPFKSVRWTCEGCGGVGQKLVPKADPEKKLP